MPLIEHNIYPDLAETGIWLIEEELDQFLNELELDPREEKELDTIAFKTRKLQWLGARYLIHKMSGRIQRGFITKSNKGKPRLESSKYFISLSHSDNYVAAAAAPFPVGVDIQVKTDKIIRILDRFTNEEENSACKSNGNLELPHLIWAAKECMFKAYGLGEVEFKKNLYIDKPKNINLNESTGTFTGKLVKQDKEMVFEFLFQINDEVVFVYGKCIDY